mgnify:FL=1
MRPYNRLPANSQPIVDAWNEKYSNVTLQIEGIGWADWRTAIQTAVLGDGVDVICHGGVLPELSIPLTSLMESDPEFAEQIYVTTPYRTDVPEGCTLETATLMSIPARVGPAGMILNKEIFDNYGVELPHSSYTWSDVVALAEQLTNIDPVTGKQTYGFLINGMGATDSMKTYRMLAYAYDAVAIDYGPTAKESVIDFNTPACTKVFETFQALAKCCSPDNIEGVESRRVYADDNVAMAWSEGLAGDKKALIASGDEDKYVFMPMPVIEAGPDKGKPCTFMGDNHFAISKSSEHQDWAWEFIKFVLTSEVSLEFAVSNGIQWNTPEGVDALTPVVGEEFTTILKEILENVPEGACSTSVYYDTTNFGGMEGYLSSALWELGKGNMNVEECVAAIDKAVADYKATLD